MTTNEPAEEIERLLQALQGEAQNWAANYEYWASGYSVGTGPEPSYAVPEALARIGAPAIEPLTRLFHEGDSYVAHLAAAALALMGDKGFAVVLDALRDPGSRHSSAARNALSGLRLRVVDRMRPLLEDLEAPEALRRAAADVLWGMEIGRLQGWGKLAGSTDTRVRDALAARRDDPNPYVRWQARSALGESQDDS